MSIKEVLSQQLSKISFSEDEMNKLKKNAINLIKDFKKYGINAYMGGSFAKNTAIKKEGLQDIDIFTVFKKESDMKILKKYINEKYSKKEFRCVHGSRDYFQIITPEIILEIIPVLQNNDSLKINNITDMSLSHVKYVNNKLKENSKLAQEIRLAKSFVIASGCYGAESYIKGFSGYSLELLIIHFGSFLNFLKKINKEKIIDIEKFFKSKNEILREINASKLDSPIIIVDPTYKYRNVCAGLSKKTFSSFLEYAKNFLKNPSLDMFEFKQVDILSLRKIASKNKSRYLEIEFACSKQEGDIAGSKMRKYFDFICEELIRNYQLLDYEYFYYPGYGCIAKGYIILKEKKSIDIRGPKKDMGENVNNFIKIHPDSFMSGDYLTFNKKININDLISSLKKYEKEMSVKIHKLIIE